ncbi:hypothetical protein QQ045_021811 [Rhodiola kirilowii]
MKMIPFLLSLVLLIQARPHLAGQFYDSSANTECKAKPETPLYGGGIIRDVPVSATSENQANGSSMPAIELHNLTAGTLYCFSGEPKPCLLVLAIINQNVP